MNILKRIIDYSHKESSLYKALHNGQINYIDLVLSRLTLNPKKIDICQVEDIQIAIRPNTTDYKVLDEVLLKDCYKLRALQKNLLEIDTIIDLGACLGDFSLFAHSLFPEAHIFAIEPEKENLALLKKNNKLNTNPFSIIPKAVSNKRNLFLVLAKQNKGGHAIQKEILGEEVQKVSSISFHRLYTTEHIETCDLLKIDCEGGEYEIFDTVKNYPHLQNTKLITMEYHITKYYPTKCLKILQERLHDLGFEYTKSRTNKEVGMLYAWNKKYIKENPFKRKTK